MLLKSILTLIIICFMTSSAHAINTEDWEGLLALQLFDAKPEKEWLLTTTDMVLKEAFPKKDKIHYKQYYNDKLNSIHVPIPNKWHDLTSFSIFYDKKESDKYVYYVSYKFVKGKMTLFDVLGRYGYELAEIETKEDLSKVIKYMLTADMPSLVGKNPIWKLCPLHKNQATTLFFSSKDKIFIDKLTIISIVLNVPQEQTPEIDYSWLEK